MSQAISSMESALEAAVDAKVIPGAILAASSADGKLEYVKAFGVRSLEPQTQVEGRQVPDSGLLKSVDLNAKGGHDCPVVLGPLTEDAIIWMGSCTKIITAIAALQCVEQGLFGLDEDVTGWLPELKDIQVQVSGEKQNREDGVASNPSSLVKSYGIITLRRLLSHTSGLSYANFSKVELPLIERCLAPLVFEPGEGFVYGTGTDFAGIMVERATASPLETYFNRHIAQPLGIEVITFSPKDKGLLSRLPEVSLRGLQNRELSHTPSKIWPLEWPQSKESPLGWQSGGSGAYCTIPDFQKILHSLTASDERLLSRAMVDELFTPDLNPKVRAAVMKTIAESRTTNNIYGGLPIGTEVSFAMGGMVVLEDVHLQGHGEHGYNQGEGHGKRRRRAKGTMHWGALLNIFFWMDRENGVSGIFGSQVFPAGDDECLGLFAKFEAGVYEALREIRR